MIYLSFPIAFAVTTTHNTRKTPTKETTLAALVTTIIVNVGLIGIVAFIVALVPTPAFVILILMSRYIHSRTRFLSVQW